MNRWLGPEGRLQNVFEWVRNTAILNVCFVLSCIPLITIGAALTALSSMNLRLLRHEEGHIFKGYWRAFRDNFAQSTKIWLFMLVIGLWFVVDFWALNQISGNLSFALKIILGALSIVYVAVLHYVFAYNARFNDSMWNCLKNSLILSGTNLLHTFSLMCITFLALFISLYSEALFLRAIFIWAVLGFAAVSLLHCYLLSRIFARYE